MKTTACPRNQAPDDGVVVGERTVAVEFVEFVEDLLGVVQGVRAQGMAAQLADLPRGEVLEDGLDFLAHLRLQPLDFFVQVDCVVRADISQLVDLGLQFGDRLFEVEVVWIHRVRPAWNRCIIARSRRGASVGGPGALRPGLPRWSARAPTAS
jgi:hypothetical protein